MCYINRCQYGGCIIRVYIADELGFHLEGIVLLCPVLQCQIHSTRAQVTTTDTDLDYCRKFLACGIGDLATVYLVGEISDTLLLLYIKGSLVHAVCGNSISQLTSGQMMQNQTVLPGIDHGTIV